MTQGTTLADAPHVLQPRHPADNELFSQSAPRRSEQQAAELALQAFGVEGRATLLTSERDQNFRIDAADGQAYVLKVTHPSEDPVVTDFQTQAQLVLAAPQAGLPVPRLLPARDGLPVFWAPLADGRARQAVRLISFLPGVPLYRQRAGAAQRRALGRELARFDLALQGFSHAGGAQKLLWDIQHLGELRPLLAHIDDAARRALAERFLDAHEDGVAAAQPALRRQVIHNDLNAYNVLVDAADPDRVTGILDFGDMVEAPLVNDLAVACAYQLADDGDPMAGAADCVAGYHALLPLSATELRLLPRLTIARLLVTVLITEWRARQHPANRAYILRNNPLSWAGLRRFDATPMAQVEDGIMNAINRKEEEKK